jgi:hypothetical protein
MTGLTKAQLLKRLVGAHRRVSKAITGEAGSGGMYARGLSTEGYAGGYRDALNDIEALLRHGHPTDSRGWWKE